MSFEFSDFTTTSINLSSLIQFDLLQKVIEQFLTAQKNIENRLELIEMKSEDLQNQLTTITINNSNNVYKTNTINEEATIDQQQQPPQSQSQSLASPTNISITQKPVIPVPSVDTTALLKIKQQLNAITQRISSIEHECKELQKTEINTKHDLSKLTEHTEQQHSTLKDAINDIKVKVQEFNIYDMFKDNNNIEGGGNLDISTALIQTLENKMQTKFNLTDEKIKDQNEDIIKIKSEYINMKNLSDAQTRVANDLKTRTERCLAENGDMINKITETTKAFSEQLKKELLNVIDKSNIKTSQLLTTQNRTIENIMKITSTKEEKEFDTKGLINEQTFENAMKDMNKKINNEIQDVEKNFKNAIEKLNTDLMRREIAKINNLLLTKIEKKDLDGVILRQDDFSGNLSFLKDQLEQRKTEIELLNESINKTMKQVEHNSGLIHDIQSSNETSHKVNENFNIDLSDYITFKDFRTQINPILNDMKLLTKEQEEIKLTLLQFQKNFQTIPTENDLKNLEQCLLNEIEEVKIASFKKFADKLETQKSFRFIDLQIRHLTESFSKDQSDNWLLAKKPLNSYLCASCDSFIGEIGNNKSEFIPWNKLQQRDENVKYRMGHGFSRMLQMVNMNILKSCEEGGNNNSIIVKDDKTVLPIINKDNPSGLNEKNSLNCSVDNIDSNNLNINDLGEIGNDNKNGKAVGINNNGPKLVKIMKKARNVSTGDMKNQRGNNEGSSRRGGKKE